MARATELAGFVGAALAGLAYIPQIWHLIHERCPAGLSRLAFSLWLTASILVTSHAVAIGEAACVWLAYQRRGLTAPNDEVRRAFVDGLAEGLRQAKSRAKERPGGRA